MPRIIIDASIRDRLQAIVIRQDAVLRNRLSELQKRHLIQADADLEAVGLMVCAQSFHISFMARVSTNLDDADLTHMISEFARYMARGLAPLEGVMPLQARGGVRPNADHPVRNDCVRG